MEEAEGVEGKSSNTALPPRFLQTRWRLVPHINTGKQQDAVPSVTLVHVATSSPTVTVSSSVARKDPSTLALAAYIDDRLTSVMRRSPWRGSVRT